MGSPFRSQALARMPHGFFGREGGVSTGAVAGLQCGFGADDDPDAVARNRAAVIAAVLSGAELVTPFQVHSPDVAAVTEAWDFGERPEVDAVVTRVPGLLLGIVTADCAPVLLADTEAGVIGAAHAGWRGAVSGVLENTVAAMCELGARRERIAAAIGPCIAQQSYEVDESFRENFSDDDARFFTGGRAGHSQFDLEGYAASRLAHSGVEKIDPLHLDTYADPQRFFSYRRATHRGEPTYGRQLSVIGLPAG